MLYFLGGSREQKLDVFFFFFRTFRLERRVFDVVRFSHHLWMRIPVQILAPLALVHILSLDFLFLSFFSLRCV